MILSAAKMNVTKKYKHNRTTSHTTITTHKVTQLYPGFKESMFCCHLRHTQQQREIVLETYQREIAFTSFCIYVIVSKSGDIVLRLKPYANTM